MLFLTPNQQRQSTEDSHGHTGHAQKFGEDRSRGSGDMEFWTDGNEWPVYAMT